MKYIYINQHREIMKNYAKKESGSTVYFTTSKVYS